MARAAAHRAENPEMHKTAAASWRERNKERFADMCAEWVSKNKEYRKGYRRAQYALKREQELKKRVSGSQKTSLPAAHYP